ncbi:DinB family protein [Rapidithrix thailandica]|uniref:DinB family protein n=1 Tax=Rapidithrix thailandica TaxID=413964 RepID=A0AAW9S502_9BACT
MKTETQANVSQVISPSELLEHWQGHRNLTRKMIEAFPEEKLFTYSIGGMRPFAEMAVELLSIASQGIKGLVTDQWEDLKNDMDHGNSKAKLLEIWDQTTEKINTYWPQLSLERFHETTVCFGKYEGKVYSLLLYFVDNEIHHRGQGYVYLRSLGIEPPYFWERL